MKTAMMTAMMSVVLAMSGALCASAQTPPEDFGPVIERAFAAMDCGFARDGGEALLAQRIAEDLGVGVDVVRDRDMGYFDAIGAVFDDWIDEGRIIMDEETDRIVLVGCGNEAEEQ